MTGQPYTCQPLDLWIETTMDLNSKLKQRMAPAFAEWETTVFDFKKYKQHGKGERYSEEGSELSESPQEARWMPTNKNEKDEQAVQDLLTCNVEFDADWFEPSHPTLRSLQSGLLATPELVTDFPMALQDGKIETFAPTSIQQKGVS